MSITYPVIKLSLGGETVVFGSADIIDATAVQEVSPIGLELPISEVTVRIYTNDARFSPFSDGSYYQGLSVNTVVDVYEMVGAIEGRIGRFYLREWRNPREGEIELVLQDAIGVLDTIPFDGLFWVDDVTLTVALETVLAQSGLQAKYEGDIGARTVSGYLPAGTAREALGQILFSTGTYAITANLAHIVIRDAALPLGDMSDQYYGAPYYGDAYYGGRTLDGTITVTDKTDKQTLNIYPLVTGIQLVSHDFTQGTTQEEIYSAYLEPGDYKIVYSKPYYNVTAEGVGYTPAYLMNEDKTLALTTEDGRILSFAGEFEFGSNYVFLHVLAAGNVVVRGYPYIDSTRVFSYDENSSAATNIWKVDKAMLVTASKGQDVLNRLIAFAKLRYKQTITLFGDSIAAALGGIYQVDSLFSKDLNAIVTRAESKLSGGFLINTELIGTERKA